MGLLRKIKISKLLNQPLSDIDNEIISFIKSWLSDLIIYKHISHPDSTFYMNRDGHFVMDDDESLPFLYIRNEHFWEVLEKKYNLSSNNIQSLLRHFISEATFSKVAGYSTWIVEEKNQFIIKEHYKKLEKCDKIYYMKIESYYNDSLTLKELKTKYDNIEDKIPSVWETYEKAGIELAQDLTYLWDIQDTELVRVICLVELNVKGLELKQHLKLSKHIDSQFSFAGLYPNIIKPYRIYPDKITKEHQNLLDEIIKSKQNTKIKKKKL